MDVRYQYGLFVSNQKCCKVLVSSMPDRSAFKTSFCTRLLLRGISSPFLITGMKDNPEAFSDQLRCCQLSRPVRKTGDEYSCHFSFLIIGLKNPKLQSTGFKLTVSLNTNYTALDFMDD